MILIQAAQFHAGPGIHAGVARAFFLQKTTRPPRRSGGPRIMTSGGNASVNNPAGTGSAYPESCPLPMPAADSHHYLPVSGRLPDDPRQCAAARRDEDPPP